MGLSERRGCRIVGLSRSARRYQPTPKNDAAVIGRLKELASENRRYGYLRLHAMLRREGLVANRERTYRLYTEQGLQVRTKKRPGATASPRACRSGRCSAGRSTSSATSSPTAGASGC